MRLGTLFVTCCCLCSIFSSSEDINRDKRTIDFVIRGLADTFGYDVQKRPSATAAVRAAPAMPAPRSTVFPPPVAPLPRTLPGPPTLSIRLFGGRQAAAPAPGAAPAPAPAPAAKPSRPVPAKPAPPAPPAPAPRPAAPAAPAARPLLRENVMKTFNVAFNFNRDLNTVAPPAPAPAPAPPAPPPPPAPRPKLGPGPAPARPPPTPASKGTLRPPSPAKPAPTPAPPPPPPPTLPPVATPPNPRKPQLYQDDYDSADTSDYDDKQNLESEDYDQPEQVSYDYKNYVKGEEQRREPTPNFEDSRERFKQSLDTFWAGSPYLQLQNTGYKYLAENVNDENEGIQEVQEVPHTPLEPPRNKYEEYDVLNEDYREPQEAPRSQKQQKFILYKSEYTPEDEDDHQDVEEADESQKQTQKQKPCNQQVEPDRKEQIVNKIIKDFKEFERQRKNLPPDPNDTTTPIKLREKQQKERERQRVIKERGQRTRDAIQKKINKGKGFVEPAYTGIIRPPLQELYQNDHKSRWPNPFDIDIAATDVENQFKRIQRETDEQDEYKSFYHPDHYEIEGDYKEPAPTPYDYSQYEKLHVLDDASLSANARIENKQFGQRTVRLRASNDTSTY